VSSTLAPDTSAISVKPLPLVVDLSTLYPSAPLTGDHAIVNHPNLPGISSSEQNVGADGADGAVTV